MTVCIDDTTGHCMVGLMDGGESSVCCPPFDAEFQFTPVDTYARSCCWVGIMSGAKSCYSDEPGGELGGEADEGRWCGWGCDGSEGDLVQCPDTQLPTMADRLDGNRWLRPSTNAVRNRDAFGMLHDLRSNEYWPVPPTINYDRGTCYYNDADEPTGRECFGTDVCACYGDNAANWFTSNPDTPCDGGMMPGFPVDGILPDTEAHTGYGWPPGMAGGNNITSGSKGMYWCRSFGAGRIGHPVSQVTLGAPSLGGMIGVAESMPAPLLVNDHNCSPNLMAYCTATIPAGSRCNTSARDTFGVDQLYYNVVTATRNRFAALMIHDQTEMRVKQSEQLPGESAIANKVLAFVGEHDFDGTRFDRVDSAIYQFGGAPSNAGLSQYWRGWANDNGVEVPDVFGECRLRVTGCPVIARLYAVAVRYYCLFVANTLRANPITLNRFVEPLARFQVIVELRVKTELAETEEPCTFVQSWRADDDPLHTQVLTLENNRVMPGVDTVEYHDIEDRIVTPPTMVEWRGMLGGRSRPSAMESRKAIDISNRCQSLAGNFDGIRIPAWPMRSESSPESPTGQYEGLVYVGFPP